MLIITILDCFNSIKIIVIVSFPFLFIYFRSKFVTSDLVKSTCTELGRPAPRVKNVTYPGEQTYDCRTYSESSYLFSVLVSLSHFVGSC